MNNKIKAAVLGCTGYTGLELVNILNNHPNVILTFLGSQSHSGEYINKFDERLKNVLLPKLNLFDEILLVGSGKGVVSLSAIPEINWQKRSDYIFEDFHKIYNALI